MSGSRRLTKGRASLALAAAVASLLCALAGCGGGGSGSPTRAAREETKPGVQACPPPGPAVVVSPKGPTLCGEAARRYVDKQTARERKQMDKVMAPRMKRARPILASDPTLRALLRGHRSHVGQTGPWSAGDGNPMGVVAQLDVEPPIAGKAVLPYVCKGDARIGGGRIQYELRGVTRLSVLVHLASARVAQIDPLEVPGAPPPDVRPIRSLPGSKVCPRSKD